MSDQGLTAEDIFPELEETRLEQLPVKGSLDRLLFEPVSKAEIERMGVVDAKQMHKQADYSILRASVLLNKLAIYIKSFRAEADKHCFDEINAELVGANSNIFERYGAAIEVKKVKAKYDETLFEQNPEWCDAKRREDTAKQQRVAHEKLMKAGNWIKKDTGEEMPQVPNLNEGKQTFSVSFNAKK